MIGPTTGLLVSVRSADEALSALAGGADVIDIKEPSRGALGPADPGVWNEVQHSVAGRAPVSAALGELLSEDILGLAAAARGLKFAKIGLAGCHGERGWIARWCAAVRALPSGVAPVPVAYADWQTADAPSPSVAIALAVQSPARLALIDTYEKGGGGLLRHLPVDSLRELVDFAGQARVRLALAGSLDEAAVARLLPLAPALIGVRAAACRGGREGAVDISLVKSLAALVHSRGKKAAG
jgi:uncharacterized protein (UPF0264 family)